MSVSPAESVPTPRLQCAAAVVGGLSPYGVKHHPASVELDLSANEGAKVDPKVLALHLERQDVRAYPDKEPLERQLAERLGVEPERLVVCAGADDALARAIRAVAEPGTEVILPQPTFGMLSHYVAQTGATAVDIPWALGAPFPLAAILEAVNSKTRAVYVASPNNPTGAVLDEAALRSLCETLPGVLVIVDLAYGEFAEEDLSPVALDYANALVVRTLSKAWGLAGARVGYAAGSTEVIGWLRLLGQPYAVSGPSLVLAERSLKSVDVGTYLHRVNEEREILKGLLLQLGQDTWPSQGNFLLGRFHDATWVYEALAGLGIRVRPFSHSEDFANALRITCPGDAAEFRRLAEGLCSALAPEAILFDMDGVLADVSRSYREAVIATANSYEVVIDGAMIDTAKGAGNANDDWQLSQRLIAEHGGLHRPLSEVTARFEALYQGTDEKPGLRERETLLPPIELLAELAKRLPLAIVTGRPRADAERFIKRHGLEPYFNVVIVREDAPLKPDPAAVRLACDRLGVKRAWMIGDTPDDLHAARGAHVVPIGITAPGDRSADTLLAAGASRVLKDLIELKELLP